MNELIEKIVNLIAWLRLSSIVSRETLKQIYEEAKQEIEDLIIETFNRFRQVGKITITGDGSTTRFEVDVPNNLDTDELACYISSTESLSAVPSYAYARLVDKDNDGFHETIRLAIRFDNAPANGEQVKVFYTCVKIPESTQ